MLKITAAKLSKNLSHYLEKVKAGEILVIIQDEKEIARIVPPHSIDRRKHMTVQSNLKVLPDELIKPIGDL